MVLEIGKSDWKGNSRSRSEHCVTRDAKCGAPFFTPRFLFSASRLSMTQPSSARFKAEDTSLSNHFVVTRLQRTVKYISRNSTPLICHAAILGLLCLVPEPFMNGAWLAGQVKGVTFPDGRVNSGRRVPLYRKDGSNVGQIVKFAVTNETTWQLSEQQVLHVALHSRV